MSTQHTDEETGPQMKTLVFFGVGLIFMIIGIILLGALLA